MKQTCELEMKNAGGARLVLCVESMAFGPEHDRRCRTALVDVTELRVADDTLRKLNEDLDQRCPLNEHNLSRLLQVRSSRQRRDEIFQ
jgi:hypothetical protein